MTTISAAAPAGFAEYWQAALDELDATPANTESEPMPMRSPDFAAMRGVRITSVGPRRLFGYLSVPTNGDGPFPAIYYPPKYQSVLEPIPQGASNALRSRFAVFAIGGRGQRLSDSPHASQFPGQLTEGIADADAYAFRGIAMDAVRGLEYLLSRPEVDASRVVSIGNDVAFIAAALRGGAPYLVCSPALFADTAALAPRSRDYPLEEINDYLNLHPQRRGAVERALSLFNLRYHAPNVRAETLIAASAPGGILDAAALRPIQDAMPGAATIFESESSSYKDGMRIERWIADKLGFDDMLLPAHWQ